MFGYFQLSGFIENKMFRKLNVFPSSDRGENMGILLIRTRWKERLSSLILLPNHLRNPLQWCQFERSIKNITRAAYCNLPSRFVSKRNNCFPPLLTTLKEFNAVPTLQICMVIILIFVQTSRSKYKVCVEASDIIFIPKLKKKKKKFYPVYKSTSIYRIRRV